MFASMFVAPQIKNAPILVRFMFWRRHPESNWGIGVLQTRALPLGYVATSQPPLGSCRVMLFYGFFVGAVVPLPHTVYSNLFTSYNLRQVYSLPLVERETRFELATSALARQRSTTEPFPHKPQRGKYIWWKL